VVIQFSPHGSVGVVAISGSLDAATADQLNEYISSQISNGYHQLVLDLCQVEFISSAGLRAVMLSVKECRAAGGDLRLSAAQPGTEKVFKISGFLSVIKSFPNIAEAIASFKA